LRGGGASTISIDLMAKLVTWATTGLKVAIVLFLASTAYILYGVYGGHLSQAVDQRILSNLMLMGQIMTASGALGALCLVIVTYGEVAYSVVAGIIGFAVMFGLPLMVAGQISSQAAQAGQVITRWANATGELMLFVVGVRLFLEIVNFIREAPARRARIDEIQGFEKPKPSAVRRPWYRMARCWEMPYCHEAIKEMCPAYLARKNCWRIRQGCNCDPHLIESLLRRGAGKEISQQDATYIRTDLTDGRSAGAKRTRECRDCPIFNEHQRDKFRVLNPLVIAGSLVGLLAAFPLVRRLYAAFIEALATLAHRLAFGSTVPVDEWVRALDSPAVFFFFYVIIGLLALSYVLKAVEWAILQRKIV